MDTGINSGMNSNFWSTTCLSRTSASKTVCAESKTGDIRLPQTVSATLIIFSPYAVGLFSVCSKDGAIYGHMLTILVNYLDIIWKILRGRSVYDCSGGYSRRNEMVAGSHRSAIASVGDPGFWCFGRPFQAERYQAFLSFETVYFYAFPGVLRQRICCNWIAGEH